MSHSSMEEELLAGLEFSLPSIDALTTAASRKRGRAGDHRAWCCEALVLQKLSPCPPLIPSDEDVVNVIATSVNTALTNDEQKRPLQEATSTASKGTEQHAPKRGEAATSHGKPMAATGSDPTSRGGETLSSSSAMKLDYNRCLDAIRGNAKKPLQGCTSALSVAQHRLYVPYVLSALQHGVASIERLAERDMLLDIVEREQATYLAKWMEFVSRCPHCVLSRSGAGSPHVCENHNCMPVSVEPFAEAYVAQRKALLHHNAVVGAPPRGETTVQLPLGPLPSQPPRAGRLVDSNLLRSAHGSSGPPIAVTHCPLLHRLKVDAVAAPVHVMTASTLGSAAPASSGIVIPFEVVVALATAMSLPDALPLRVAFQAQASDAGHPSVRFAAAPCSAVVRRREVLEAAFAAAVDSDSALSLVQRNQYQAMLHVPRAAGDAPLTIASTVFAEDITDRIMLRMVKLEYSCKGNRSSETEGVLSHQEETTAFEEFSKAELIEMHLALTLHPQAHVIVFHVDPYTCTLLAVETFTPTTFSSMLWTPKDPECTLAWGRALQAINALVGYVASMKAPDPPTGGNHGIRVLQGVLECTASPPSATSEGTGPVVMVHVGAEDRLLRDIGIEPSSDAVVKREYLGPSVWPHVSDRIPFTFPPPDAVANKTAHASVMMRGKLAGKALIVKRTAAPLPKQA